MSGDSSGDDSSDVGTAIVEWFDAADRGVPLDREEFLRRHREIGTELRRFFEDYDSFRAKAQVSALAPPSAGGAARALDRARPAPVEIAEHMVAASANYRDLRFFKKGGLGTLYRAVDESLHRETIVKFIRDDCADDPVLHPRFQAEAEITARLDHPGVVPVYAIGETSSGRPFYVMQLVKGRELSLAIEEYHSTEQADSRRTSARQRLCSLLEHLVRACNTVAYAHDVGIIHCDIKPSNIMIGRYGETFVLDWGLAASFERTTNFRTAEPSMRPRAAAELSEGAQRGGTYGYISPEQLDPDQPIGPASDVYSLGATLYEILTGTAPFNGRDQDVIRRIRAGLFPPPRELKKDVPRQLEAICRKAMQLRPHDRYGTAKRLAADLTNWMRDEEVQAAPDRWFDRLARLSRRHRALTAVTLISSVALAVAGAWIDWTRKSAAHEQELRIAQDRQSDLVETSFKTALDTFEDLCRPLANGELNNLGVFRRFADRIDAFANVYLDKFEKTRSMALHTGRVYELRATVSRVLSSDTNQALRHYRKAEEIYREIKPGVEADAIELDRRIAHIHLSQGRLHLLRHEFGPAEDLLNQAREALERQRDKQPDDSELLRDLAEVYHSLGEVYLDRDADGLARHQALLESRDQFEKSKALREKLIETARGSERSNHQRDLARSLGRLGDLSLAQGKVADAVTNYERSKDLRQELYNSNPTDPEHRFQLARGYSSFGKLDRDFRANLGESIKNFQATASFQEKLAEDFPEVARFQRDYGGTLNSLAEVYLLEAAQDSEKLVEYGKLAREAVDRAAVIFGDITRHSDRQADSEGVHGLALSYLMLAVLEQLNQGADMVRHAEYAESLLFERLGREPVLERSQLVTLALSRSLQGKAESALRTLKDAIDRGENTVARFERHRTAGFRAIAENSALGLRFDELCKELREKLSFE